MGFSEEWETLYQQNEQNSVWPWSNLVSLAHRYGNLHENMRVLELGCGAGANIPFFVSQKAEYYGIDGSQTVVERLQKRFEKQTVHVMAADFTKMSTTGGAFDLIIDRSALTCCTTADLRHVITFIRQNLAPGGRFLGMDWQSVSHDEFKNAEGETIDPYTRVLSTGYFAGMGTMHFETEEHLRELFKGFRFLYLTEKVELHHVPEVQRTATWDFVVERVS